MIDADKRISASKNLSRICASLIGKTIATKSYSDRLTVEVFTGMA